MNTSIKFNNQTITLPKEWKGIKVFIKRSKDTIIIKKMKEPLRKLSDLALKISSSKISFREIEKEIQNYRKNK